MPGYDGKLLILGGTAQAYGLAERLARRHIPVITSLAGRTQNPWLPQGQFRIGGFGGVEGLAHYIRHNDIRLVVDATHPFATQITANAIAAADKAGVALLRLERPVWQPQAGDNWIKTTTLEEAARAIPDRSKVFLAIGRQHLGAFAQRDDAGFIARMIEPPEQALPFRMLHIVLDRPGKAAQEMRFLLKHRISCMVCRNSGGRASYGKIIAARKLSLPVIMINRKPTAYAPVAGSVKEAMIFIDNQNPDKKP